ncbi:DUF1800 domain-containing protein [Acidobacteria bacterium AH-259-D05]|nr:DUF1800 domain-containing protein [Acidobacteria bacterium AH-259-D05]
MRRGVPIIFLSLVINGLLSGQGARFETPGMQDPAGQSPVVLHPCPPCGPWDSTTAAHLMRRAGFSASPEELDRWVQKGFEATLNELLNYEEVDDTEMEEGLAEKNYPLTRMNQNFRLRPNTFGMQRWWLYRMVNSKRQLLEKMTYFWHDHFATSVNTVRRVGVDEQPYMMTQNELLREYALGNFKEMVEEMAKDPAMLIWLDNVSNVKQHPNENWGRELLELFTLGVGNYTDQDVLEAARAFTGWGLNRSGEFNFFSSRHDYEMKTFLDVTGPLDGSDIIDIIFEQDVAAEYMAGKLFEFFVYPDPSEEIISELGDVFRENDYEMRPLMRAIFEHPEFYSDRAYRALIKSPVELLVGIFRELGASDPQFLPRFMTGMGQDLFAPPDVSGWTSGVGWINTSTLLARYNFFNRLATFRGDGSGSVVEWVQQNHLTSWNLVQFLVNAIVQNDVSVDTLYVLEEYLRTEDSGQLVEFDINDPVMIDKKVRGLIYLILALPVYQLN